jgi:hypothetical protein
MPAQAFRCHRRLDEPGRVCENHNGKFKQLLAGKMAGGSGIFLNAKKYGEGRIVKRTKHRNSLAEWIIRGLA